MSLNLTEIANLWRNRMVVSSPILMVIDYAVLKEKLHNSDHQSWYFKKDAAAKKQELEVLAASFESVRNQFNESTIDSYLDEISENKVKMERISTATGMNAVVSLRYGLLRDRNTYLEELIRIKTKTATLMPMDFYLEDPEALMEIIG